MQTVVLASAVRAATNSSPDMSGLIFSALQLAIAVTVVPGVDTVTPHIQGKDLSGNYYDVLVGAAIVAVGEYVFDVGQGIANTANLDTGDVLPDVWRLNMVHSAVTNFTYAASATLKV